MAFEEDLGYDPSQRMVQNYSLSATEIVSRTVSMWAQKLVQYIIIVGIISAACVLVSFLLLFALFSTIGTLGVDPISFLIGFLLDPLDDLTLIVVSLGFAIIAFVLNAIIYGSAIKFALDEYGGSGGNISRSFSRSFGRILRVIIVQIILSFFVAIGFTPGTILAIRALDMIDISDPYNPIIQPGAFELLLSALGFIIVGGILLIYLQVRFAPTLAIVIDTDLSAIGSLSKSWELTRGNFFHVFGSYMLLILAVFVLNLIVTVGLAFTPISEDYSLVIESLVSALLFSSFNYIFVAVLYRDLVSRKGTTDLPEFVL